MSAPPIGMMISTPSAKASAVIARNGVQSLSSARKNAAPRPIMTSPRTRLSQCWPGNTTGADENRRNFLPRPASLPNAITDPENVIAPTKVPMNSSSLRSEEHTSELQSRLHLVCRLLLEKKNKNQLHTLATPNSWQPQ